MIIHTKKSLRYLHPHLQSSLLLKEAKQHITIKFPELRRNKEISCLMIKISMLLDSNSNGEISVNEFCMNWSRLFEVLFDIGPKHEDKKKSKFSLCNIL